MKILVLAAAAAVGLAGVSFAGDVDGPTLLTDGQLDLIVAGKKPRTDNGNGTDTGGGDTGANLVYSYDHDKSGSTVLLDYDSGTSTNKHYSNCQVGYIDGDGIFVSEGAC